jgi:hypothetical protein
VRLKASLSTLCNFLISETIQFLVNVFSLTVPDVEARPFVSMPDCSKISYAHLKNIGILNLQELEPHVPLLIDYIKN